MSERLYERLRSTRDRLRAFPVPNASEKTLNPEYCCLKAEEEETVQALRDLGLLEVPDSSRSS